jgi:hypothetical protein
LWKILNNKCLNRWLIEFQFQNMQISKAFCKYQLGKMLKFTPLFFDTLYQCPLLYPLSHAFLSKVSRLYDFCVIICDFSIYSTNYSLNFGGPNTIIHAGISLWAVNSAEKGNKEERKGPVLLLWPVTLTDQTPCSNSLSKANREW